MTATHGHCHVEVKLMWSVCGYGNLGGKGEKQSSHRDMICSVYIRYAETSEMKCWEGGFYNLVS